MATIGNRQEEQEQREEQPNAPMSVSDVDHRGREVAPRTGQEVAVQRGDVMTNRSNHIPMLTKMATTNMNARGSAAAS
jgi:hypothetical protein